MFYVLFFLLQLLLPLCFGVGVVIDRAFVLVSEPLVLLVLTGATVALTVKLYRGKDSRWAFFAPLVSLVNGITMLVFLDWWGAIFGAVAVVVCGWVLYQRMTGVFWRALCYFLSVLLTFAAGLCLLLFSAITLISTTDVMRQLDSPENSRTARIEVQNAGAIADNTRVIVRDNAQSFSLGFGSFVEEFTVYSGSWGEHEGMTLVWQDEDTLLINGVPYTVDAPALAGRRNALDALDISMSRARVIEYSDTHGGFHGDGTTVLVLSGEAYIPESRFWHDLPMTEEARKALAHFGLAVPEMENGQWFFLDRHYESTDPADVSALFDRHSYNFTMAVYDGDAGVLYYWKVDT